MNFDNRSQLMLPSARISHRNATASRYFATKHLLTEGFSFGGIQIRRTSESTA